ncbi:MAG TPA: isoprenylcysteine carboxylmethyltransferase family protein [Vicinamibacterales bacterium]|nr:isoprenylcysteine carboxylmethyltransferase family protein [Vicinamibacterales bacterium]
MIAVAGAVIFAAMIVEALLASTNERALRAAGAIEPAGDVYRIMQLAYPACFLAMLAEGAARSVGADAGFAIGTAVFAAGKALKYWAIVTLGPRWTFRVLVPPGGARIRRGPYRWLAHPNYAGVAGELLGVAIAMSALLTGPFAVAGFCLLMRRRVLVEEAALRQSRMSGTEAPASERAAASDHANGARR